MHIINEGRAFCSSLTSPFHPFTFSPLKRSSAHTARRTQCREEGRECGYYDLHRKLNHTLLLHKP